MDWLIHFVGEKLDWGQFGGIKGSSSSHYLIDMITYILYNQDLKEPKAVIAAMLDFEKAFNRQNHHKLIKKKLSDMGVPGWLLRIIIGLLEKRTLVVSYKGEKSGTKEMPGGGPQGTILGMFLFLVLINDAGFKNERESIGLKITEAFNKRKELKEKHWKYVDDLTVAEAIRLKNSLVNEEDEMLDKPLTYHNRTKQVVPYEASKVQKQLEEIREYAALNEMKVNHRKSKAMLFNTSRKHDFTSSFSLNNEIFEVAEEIKLLGVKISGDHKFKLQHQIYHNKGSWKTLDAKKA